MSFEFVISLLVLKPVTAEVTEIISCSPRSDEIMILIVWI